MKKLSQKKRLMTAAIAFCAAALEYQGSRFEPFHKYIRDAFFLIAVGSAVFAVYHFFLWLWRALKAKAQPKLKKVWNRISRTLHLFNSKIKEVFFVPRGSARLSGRDERSFIRKKNERKTVSAKSWKKLPRYETLRENRDKIRYIYIKLVADGVRRGFKLDRSSTPNQVIDQLVKEDSGFAPLYNGARYAGESFTVSDSEVADGMRIIRGR